MADNDPIMDEQIESNIEDYYGLISEVLGLPDEMPNITTMEITEGPITLQVKFVQHKEDSLILFIDDPSQNLPHYLTYSHGGRYISVEKGFSFYDEVNDEYIPVELDQVSIKTADLPRVLTVDYLHKLTGKPDDIES